MAVKKVLFTELLDKAGKDLTGTISNMQKDTLKPASMSDIAGAYSAVFWMQQLMTMLYNLQVKNYELMMTKITALEEKNKALETKINEGRA